MAEPNSTSTTSLESEFPWWLDYLQPWEAQKIYSWRSKAVTPEEPADEPATLFKQMEQCHKVMATRLLTKHVKEQLALSQQFSTCMLGLEDGGGMLTREEFERVYANKIKQEEDESEEDDDELEEGQTNFRRSSPSSSAKPKLEVLQGQERARVVDLVAKEKPDSFIKLKPIATAASMKPFFYAQEQGQWQQSYLELKQQAEAESIRLAQLQLAMPLWQKLRQNHELWSYPVWKGLLKKASNSEVVGEIELFARANEGLPLSLYAGNPLQLTRLIPLERAQLSMENPRSIFLLLYPSTPRARNRFKELVNFPLHQRNSAIEIEESTPLDNRSSFGRMYAIPMSKIMIRHMVTGLERFSSFVNNTFLVVWHPAFGDAPSDADLYTGEQAKQIKLWQRVREHNKNLEGWVMSKDNHWSTTENEREV